ncbi:hypothetical protein PAPYR_10568 [Paratrimastix pyriformis]|uniref:Uncharacterized protein n=1 Tax=Paratrimastix pyriformis TaxID=342808 RepID=A0ABQ8U9W2_9EUKA|nr:hypothetical protein PAPYR_10568 [Paratrimastix pyriformis]
MADQDIEIDYEIADLEGMKRAQLQALAKKHHIKANLKSVDIIEALTRLAHDHQCKVRPFAFPVRCFIIDVPAVTPPAIPAPSTPVRATPVRATPVRATPVRATPVRTTPVRTATPASLPARSPAAPAPAPGTPAPVTPAPATPAPVPVTPAPATPAPATWPAPASPAHATPAPATPAHITPTTPAPATPAPATPAPATPAPATPAPATPAPATPALPPRPLPPRPLPPRPRHPGPVTPAPSPRPPSPRPPSPRPRHPGPRHPGPATPAPAPTTSTPAAAIAAPCTPAGMARADHPEASPQPQPAAHSPCGMAVCTTPDRVAPSTPVRLGDPVRASPMAGCCETPPFTPTRECAQQARRLSLAAHWIACPVPAALATPRPHTPKPAPSQEASLAPVPETPAAAAPQPDFPTAAPAGPIVSGGSASTALPEPGARLKQLAMQHAQRARTRSSARTQALQQTIERRVHASRYQNRPALMGERRIPGPGTSSTSSQVAFMPTVLPPPIKLGPEAAATQPKGAGTTGSILDEVILTLADQAAASPLASTLCLRRAGVPGSGRRVSNPLGASLMALAAPPTVPAATGTVTATTPTTGLPSYGAPGSNSPRPTWGAYRNPFFATHAAMMQAARPLALAASGEVAEPADDSAPQGPAKSGEASEEGDDDDDAEEEDGGRMNIPPAPAAIAGSDGGAAAPADRMAMLRAKHGAAQKQRVQAHAAQTSLKTGKAARRDLIGASKRPAPGGRARVEEQRSLLKAEQQQLVANLSRNRAVVLSAVTQSFRRFATSTHAPADGTASLPTAQQQLPEQQQE